MGNGNAASLTHVPGNEKASLFILPAVDAKMAMESGRTYIQTMNSNEFEFWKAKGQFHPLTM